MEKEVENEIWIELEDEPFMLDIVLYKDGTSERFMYPM